MTKPIDQNRNIPNEMTSCIQDTNLPVQKEMKEYGTPEHSLTDIGNAERFVTEHVHNTRYCQDTNNWLIYEKGRFVSDYGGLVLEKAETTVKGIYSEAHKENISLIEREKILAHAKKSSTPGKMKAMLKLSQYKEKIMVRAHELDTDPYLFNSKNGTLHLETGELKGHSIEDLLTKKSPINYNADAKCPIWDGFVKQIMNNSQEKIDFLQRIFGYALTGEVNEQCLFILYGRGANGKSTMIETIREILGNYAMNVSSSTLLSQNFLSIRNDIARLNGPRFVSAAEVPMGRKLDETLVKQLTGGENVTSRFLYKEVFEYRPAFKLFLSTNHKPEIRGVDEGIWRRIHLIPFDVSIPEEQIDKQLPAKLKSELEGILAWVVRGCIEWQKRGLDVPDDVRRATAQCRKEMDLLDEFLEDECTIGPGNKISLADAYSGYAQWADQVCQDAIGKNAFGNLMKQRGFAQSKSGGVRYWIGLNKKQVTSTS